MTIAPAPDAWASADAGRSANGGAGGGADRGAGGGAGGASARRRGIRRVTILLALAGVVVLDIRLFAPYASGSAAALAHPVLGWLTFAVAAEIVSMSAAGHLQRRMLQAGGTRVPAPTMISLTYAANALSMSLPAGVAMSAGYMFRRLRQLGATVPIAGFTLLSSGVLSTVAYGILAVVGIALAGGSAGSPVAVVGAVLAASALIFALRWLLRHLDVLDRAVVRVLPIVNRVLRRPPDSGLNSIVESTAALRKIDPRGRDWAVGLVFAFVNWVGDLACLVASCHAVGAHRAAISIVLLAYLAGMSVSSISLVPGGLGVVDAALIVMLVHGGVSATAASSGVVLYRVLSFGFVVVAGWVAWAGHWLAGHDHERTIEGQGETVTDLGRDPSRASDRLDRETEPTEILRERGGPVVHNPQGRRRSSDRHSPGSRSVSDVDTGR